MAKLGRPRKEQSIADPTPLRDMGPAMEAVERESVPEPEPHPSDREASREARTETRHGHGRRRRKPLGVPEQRLGRTPPPGMKDRWINDHPGRIQRALEAGYEFITPAERGQEHGEIINSRDGADVEIVGTGRDGGALKAYYMAIPTVLYEEDQAVKQKPLDATDEAIRRGIPQIDPQKAATPEDRKSFYTPSEGISYRTSDTQ